MIFCVSDCFCFCRYKKIEISYLNFGSIYAFFRHWFISFVQVKW